MSCVFLVQFRNKPGDQSEAGKECDLSDVAIAQREVSPSEGNEARREETQEVRAI